MSVSVLTAGKRLGERAGWTLTNLQMQKMVYLAHMFYMGKYQEPLVSGEFQAWDLGPVHPILYRRLKKYGSDKVPALEFRDIISMLDDEPGCTYLDAAVRELSRKNLVAMTHWSGGAWRKNYQPYVRNIAISNADIMEEYRMIKDDQQ